MHSAVTSSSFVHTLCWNRAESTTLFCRST